MKKRLFLAFAATAIISGTAGYGALAMSFDRNEAARIATTAYVRAICGSDLATCEGVIVERPGTEGNREYHLINGAVYWRAPEVIDVTPEMAQPTVLGMACTGIPISEFDDTGHPGPDEGDVCVFHRRAPLQVN